MVSENENWLIEIGDVVMTQITDFSLSSPSEIERGIYCFWVIDYSVQNSGSLIAIQDIYPDALSELNQFAREKFFLSLTSITTMSKATDEVEFCGNFYQHFAAACNEIRALYERA